MSVFAELRRRNVFKVAAAYVVVVWLLIQAADILLPTFGAPAWVARTFTVLLVLGFPLALVLAWAYELTPEGIKRTQQIPLEDRAARLTGQKLNYVVTGLLIISVGYLLVDNFVLDTAGPFAGAEVDPAPLAPTENQGSGVGTAIAVTAEDQRRILPNSVAVLRFANLSPDLDDAYFADGVHESVLNELAKVRDLSVIARTSVLRYADGATPIPEIAAALKVQYVMEGSVRYAGDRVRITAQLIDAATGVHRWSEEFDRDLTDIFAIQSEIATRIAMEVGAQLLPSERESIERPPTDSPAASALYLRAIASRIGTGASAEALDYLDRAIELDPNFALAYGEKALQLSARGRLDPLVEAETARMATEAAEQALRLDPNTASAHAALAALHAAYGRWAEAEQAYEQAYQLNPNDTGVLIAYGSFRRDAGQYDEAIRLLQRAADLDPGADRSQLGIAYRYARDFDTAAAAFVFNIDLNPADAGAHGQLAFNEIARGDAEKGFRELRTAEQLGLVDGNPQRIAQLAYAYSRLPREQDVERLFDRFQELDAMEPIADAQWAMMYLARNDYERAAERLQAIVDDPVGESGLGHITANLYADPVLDRSPFRELRDQLYSLR